jgi:trigger factor
MIKITINKLDKSEVEILGTLEVTEFEKYEEKALSAMGERLELPGFRKGKAPASMVKESVKEMELLEEMAELALYDAYPKILTENKVDAIGRPQIHITKIGKGADLEFKIITAVLPEVKLGDYKKIAKEQNSKDDSKKEIIIEEKDVEKVILDLRKMRAEQSKPAHEHVEGEDEAEHAKAHAEIPESEYPEFNDEFVKTFGDFANTDAFKEKIKSNLKIEKETEQKDKLRLLIVEELVKQTEVEVPEILIENETDKILYRLQADITNMGFQFEEYLKQIAKTEADLRNEFHGEAEKRAKLQMIIRKISEIEKLTPTEEEIEKDVVQITTMYKDADPARARAYVEQMLENEKVFNFLEKQ